MDQEASPRSGHELVRPLVNSNNWSDGMERTEINSQIDLLRDKVLLMGGKAEESVNKAIRSLTERDSEMAESVRESDRLIDQMELEIDKLSIEILASQRPTEHDLRMVVSVAKITPILERIADHAASIAEAAIVLNNEPQVGNYIDFSLMADIASGMLREALNAFTAEDSLASREIIARDRQLDSCYGRVFDELLDLMIRNPSAANGAARLLFVAKHIERIGDYVKDICELNVYLTEAVFIKHSPSESFA
ncbi:MAG: phosphate signaling complex protein PhoU [Acidobacteria bacterium]|nr:phosphate signaling complex protein PhoU [Acidobacteriota bacterium]MCW5948029.1 phosphate signaling complex protein PhoU [Pyrinomonadaceae bacterium]